MTSACLDYPRFQELSQRSSAPITEDEAARQLRGVLERSGENNRTAVRSSMARAGSRYTTEATLGWRDSQASITASPPVNPRRYARPSLQSRARPSSACPFASATPESARPLRQIHRGIQVSYERGRMLSSVRGIGSSWVTPNSASRSVGAIGLLTRGIRVVIVRALMNARSAVRKYSSPLTSAVQRWNASG